MNALDAVYVDVLFMINVLINGSTLLLTAWVRGVRATWWRVLLSASLGAGYAVMLVFPSLSLLFSIPLKLLFSIMMLLAAFGFGSIQVFLRYVGAFYAVNFAAGGTVFGLQYLLMNGSNRLWDSMWMVNGNIHTELKLSSVFLLSSVCIGLYIYRSVMVFRKEKTLVESHLAEVCVTIGDRMLRCTGLIDTGNQLYEPLTRTPVMVMEASLWQADLPPSWLKGIKEAQVDKLIAHMDAGTFAWQDRLRLVPYRGINRGAQFMLAIKPDLVVIDREGETFESTKVLIGLDAGKLVADGAYQAIIHPSLLQNRIVTNEAVHSSPRRDGASCSSNGN
ncbi:sigma-E processing peptidase SpoIIGA [Paenibacillus mendelii]|uniref:Sigma-E processing peptidase SpoIIGA n=1 Tax=Paenibacillus mendelii TaxID=206163 RepID=A0ABV6JHJ5_9BACL|nr:sigma-E processing peptidase SpoIIGA [Paenibacillus mendelii]MCQ6558258.1 sigma-E processing peptidase SpoIIGA [Paenibacillus mendelii]